MVDINNIDEEEEYVEMLEYVEEDEEDNGRRYYEDEDKEEILKNDKKIIPHIVIGAPIYGRGIKSKAESEERKVIISIPCKVYIHAN